MKRTLLKNGTIIDGSGNPPFNGDVFIFDGVIKDIGAFDGNSNMAEMEIIDATGFCVTPGFIDIHRHADYALFEEDFGNIELAQGITTAITGSCGLTPFPSNSMYKRQLDDLLLPCLGQRPMAYRIENYKDYAAMLDKRSFPINVANLVGSCSVRIAVKGFEKSPFTAKELELAKALIGESVDCGAYGLSMGIMYYPEFYSTEDELTEMAKVVAKRNGVLTCHMRGEGDSLVASVEEICNIAERSEVSLEISHFKACGVNNWNRTIGKAIEFIDSKRSKGMNINVDFYPYTGGSTTLLSLIPPCFMRSTLSETWDYMATEKAVKELESALEKTYKDWDNYVLSLGFERIVITSVQLEKNKIYVGKSIADIIKDYKLANPCEFICCLMAEERGQVGIIVMSMSADDVDTVAKLPYSMLISDSLYARNGNAHPRLYGSFPKLLRDFVSERKILSIQEAVHKMSGLPAKKMGLRNRGLIKAGYKADIAIFNQSKFKDNADFAFSARMATGMERVLVDGNTVWLNEECLNKQSGTFIKRVGKEDKIVY